MKKLLESSIEITCLSRKVQKAELHAKGRGTELQACDDRAAKVMETVTVVGVPTTSKRRKR